ncbi:1,3-beta-D-glucan synthase [Ceratobasidium sp. 428]|nr:1,3-beta-D-glucan synthase [Ceratobasidium sp. 428]
MCRAIPLPPYLDQLDIHRHHSATYASVTGANKLIADGPGSRFNSSLTALHNTPGLSYCAPPAALRPGLCPLFLLVTLGLLVLRSISTSSTTAPLILGIVQFFLAIIATPLFSILPSGCMFGDRVASKSRKYLATRTFTASYPNLTRNQRLGSIALWFIVFACKFVESYFYLTLSFKDPISVMTGMKIQRCSDRIFGSGLCSNHAAFTLAIMFIMDLSLFFLDTYL